MKLLCKSKGLGLNIVKYHLSWALRRLTRKEDTFSQKCSDPKSGRPERDTAQKVLQELGYYQNIWQKHILKEKRGLLPPRPGQELLCVTLVPCQELSLGLGHLRGAWLSSWVLSGRRPGCCQLLEPPYSAPAFTTRLWGETLTSRGWALWEGACAGRPRLSEVSLFTGLLWIILQEAGTERELKRKSK